MLYNGTDPFPEEATLRLSDSFMELPGIEGLGGSLDLEVRVININEGHNEEMVTRCRFLHGYVRFTAAVRKYRLAGYDLNEALTRALEDGLKEELIPEFLQIHGSEVLNFMTLIYDQEEAKKYERAEAREEGREEGFDTAAMILRALKQNEPVEDIAARYRQPVSKIIYYRTILES